MLNILVVDDSAFSRNILIRNLPEEHQYEITQVSSGEEALEAYAPERFDLVFMDLTMPGIGGLSAAEEIIRGDGDAKILIVTADIQERSRRRASDIGVSQFIAKPPKTNVLRTALDSLL